MRRIALWICKYGRLPGALAFGLLSFGCGDGTGPGETVFMRFEVDGQVVEYTQEGTLLAAFSGEFGQQFLFIGGFDETTLLAVEIYDLTRITPNTYSGYTVSGSSAQGVVIRYEAGGGHNYETAGTEAADRTATVTEISARTISGTFSGTLSATDQEDIVITNGEFRVSRTN